MSLPPLDECLKKKIKKNVFFCLEIAIQSLKRVRAESLSYSNPETPNPENCCQCYTALSCYFALFGNQKIIHNIYENMIISTCTLADMN